GIKVKDINQATGKQMSRHWFSDSQWSLPNEVDYQKLQVLFGGKLNRPHQELVAEHEQLSRQYKTSLKQQDYTSLRRPFSVTADVPYTDVWQFAPVQYSTGKHPCEKPADLMEHIIQSSSREGDVVA
ncbi:DNA methyltransferase, partial [Xenorhabdus littoralis]|uniref:DNA methyltransferase n=1 Tax=Xenorhabdus littoralis TaxID=2582835 RepID=UPI0029E7E7EC